MSTSEGYKSLKHKRVTRSTATAAAAVAAKQTAFKAQEETVFKAQEEDFDDDSRIDYLKTAVKALKRSNNALVKEIGKLKGLIDMLIK